MKHPTILERLLCLDCESGYPVSDGSVWRVARERGALLRISNGEEGRRTAIRLRLEGDRVELNVDGHRVAGRLLSPSVDEGEGSTC